MKSLLCVFALSLFLGGSSGASAAGVDDKSDKRRRAESEEADVKNFGKVNEHIYRGGQPKEKEYRELSAMGIKTVIDLREDAESYARTEAERAGLKYINLRLNAKTPPTMEESNQFLGLVKERAHWPVFVHCAGGRHRTGVLVAVYRMEVDGWTAEQAYREMKDFKFYSNFGYGKMKDYVFDYYGRMGERRPAVRSRTVSVDPR
ncbi:MAG: dual specificity protein phosphatase family protein [Blastocatellia bacterium]|nr:dual specificity protein phosphatase family protein [Blastocatellia bacterium]